MCLGDRAWISADKTTARQISRQGSRGAASRAELARDSGGLEECSPFEPGTRGWITRERSSPGHIGDPRQASAEKGEILCRLFAGDVAAFLDRVIAWDGRSWDG